MLSPRTTTRGRAGAGSAAGGAGAGAAAGGGAAAGAAPGPFPPPTPSGAALHPARTVASAAVRRPPPKRARAVGTRGMAYRTSAVLCQFLIIPGEAELI